MFSIHRNQGFWANVVDADAHAVVPVLLVVDMLEARPSRVTSAGYTLLDPPKHIRYTRANLVLIQDLIGISYALTMLRIPAYVPLPTPLLDIRINCLWERFPSLNRESASTFHQTFHASRNRIKIHFTRFSLINKLNYIRLNYIPWTILFEFFFFLIHWERCENDIMKHILVR